MRDSKETHESASVAVQMSSRRLILSFKHETRRSSRFEHCPSSFSSEHARSLCPRSGERRAYLSARTMH